MEPARTFVRRDKSDKFFLLVFFAKKNRQIGGLLCKRKFRCGNARAVVK